MTGILNLTGRLLKGALVGGLVAMSCGFGLLTFLGILSYGIGGLLMGVYFGALPIYYAAPVGMLVGAVVSLIRMVRQGDESIGAAGGVWAGLLLIGLAVVAVIPHRVIGEERMITHGATWVIEAEGERECAVPVVTLYLVDYGSYETLCSAVLLDMLENAASEVVPITYRVTYDFGDVRGYSLRQVGDIEMAPREWLGGGRACGRAPFPTCHSPEDAKTDQMLYESSWVE